MNDQVLEVPDDILFRGRFVAVALEGSGDQITRAEANRQGEREHDAAEENAETKIDNDARDAQMIEHHGDGENEDQPLCSQA